MPPESAIKPGSSPWKEALFWAVFLQGFVFIITGMILDGGVMGQICLYAMAAHWVGVAVIFVRRRKNPTPGDLIFVRRGFILLFGLAVILCMSIWSLT